MNYKVKLIVGFRRDQEHTIDADEAHKAYYLFLHPEARTVFRNGLAIKGDQIQEIVPDYQATMGWNPTHVLNNDDWSELKSSGVSSYMQKLLGHAKLVAEKCDEREVNTPLSQLMATKYPLLQAPSSRVYSGMSSVGTLLSAHKD